MGQVIVCLKCQAKEAMIDPKRYCMSCAISYKEFVENMNKSEDLEENNQYGDHSHPLQSVRQGEEV